MGTLIDRVGSRGFGATRRGRMESSLAVDKSGGQVETVLGDTEGVERNMDWKALLVRCTWSILCATLYYALGSVLVGRPYGMVVIWF